MSFPLAKLGFLLLKQLSRPVANFIKNEAKQHPYFRKHFCRPPARAYYWLDMHLKSRKIRQGEVSYASLTEDEEVELGATLLGEIILFTLLSTILYLEVARQGDKKKAKERMKEDEIHNVVDTISDLMEDVNALKDSVKKLRKKLDSSVEDLLDLDGLKFELQIEDTPEAPLHLRDILHNALRKKRATDNEEVEDYEPENP